MLSKSKLSFSFSCVLILVVTFFIGLQKYPFKVCLLSSFGPISATPRSGSNPNFNCRTRVPFFHSGHIVVDVNFIYRLVTPSFHILFPRAPPCVILLSLSFGPQHVWSFAATAGREKICQRFCKSLVRRCRRFRRSVVIALHYNSLVLFSIHNLYLRPSSALTHFSLV